MAEFRLERFKYTWKGEWTSDTSYRRDDVIRVSGKSYVCVLSHVSSTTFSQDLLATLPGSNPPQPEPRWILMTDGKSFVGQWSSATQYELGDITLLNGSLYICNFAHESTDFETTFEYWDIFASGIEFLGDWTGNTEYTPGAIVKYNGFSYRCIETHTSLGFLEDDIEKWEVFIDSYEYQGELTSTTYRKGDLVKYGGSIYYCNESHISGETIDDTKFTLTGLGSQYEDFWDPSTFYNIGDVVRYNGFMYYSLTNNSNTIPYNEFGSEDWLLLARSYFFLGEWSETGKYKPGDLVIRGGNLYTAQREITQPQIDESSLDYLDPQSWTLTIQGNSFKGLWSLGTYYSLNDVVYYLGTAYSCNYEHLSSTQNFPGDNGNAFDFWDIYIEGGQPGGLTTKGDLLTYGLSRQLVGVGESQDGSSLDTSTLGDTRIPIGEPGELLSITEDFEQYYRNISEVAEAVYVASNGIDDIERGTEQAPFATIGFAAEYVEDTFPALTPVTIYVSGGKFEEVSPIIIPAGCAVVGDELRSTTIIASGPVTEYQNDFQYTQAYLDHFESIVFNLITGESIIAQEGNTLEQIIRIDTQATDPETGQLLFDPITGDPVLETEFPVSTLDAATHITDLVLDYENYIDFNSFNGDIVTTMLGSNITNTDVDQLTAAESLTLNLEFIIEDIANFTINTFQEQTFSKLRLKKDIRALMRGIIRDLTYTGNYGVLTAAKRYSNAISGSKNDNLFLVRDTTGLRNVTINGLEGTLNPPGVFELYQKPTGGACVSLDPGWGPDDERTWIVNRSPYIQGVTNIGKGCVGKKVDGALHNGGNRSMVSNDFTQVLSDGIGVWVTNNARTELVSVFTYYCQIGYFAEDGGVIRATNGNNSYGKYGSIATGVDNTEVPQEAIVNTRTEQAIISEAFAGGSTDEILLFEYANAGQNYFNADASIVGAGAFADIEYTDFRDQAVFEARLTSPDGSSKKGGSGYRVTQGNAQETADASSSIILSQNDTTQFLSEIQGMRVLILNGVGVGQYGYVDDYNFVTKTVTVRRDSDDELGWDHIIPGTPLAASFDLTTQYRIEPRVSVSEPTYANTTFDAFTNRNYVNGVYGDTTQTFNDVTGNGRYLWTDTIDESVTVKEIISETAIQFDGYFVVDPNTPFNIQGRDSRTTATVNTITANTGSVIEAELSTTTGFIVGETIEIVVTSGTGESFDLVAVPAVFDITRSGRTYTASLQSGGSGYETGDRIVILGTSLGGDTPTNDMTITVDSVSADSTNSIQTYTVSGVGKSGKFVALTENEYARFSDNGESWTEVALPYTASTWKTIISGYNKFIAIGTGPTGDNRYASSLDGQVWTSGIFPHTEDWQDGTFGGEKFVIVGSGTDKVLVSSDGINWSTGSIPDDTDGAPDSTTSLWTAVTYGKGKYLAISTSDRATATSSDGITWIRHDSALPSSFTLPGGLSRTHINLEYGNNRYVATTSHGKTAYSFDGITWYESTDIRTVLADFLSYEHSLKYSNGIFLLTGGVDTAISDKLFTSEDGVLWRQRLISKSANWSTVIPGYINDNHKWVVLAQTATTDAILHVDVGARAKLRADVLTGIFQQIKIWDCGSSYTTTPSITITDPNPTTDVAVESRISNRVLAQPDFNNRGQGYRSTTSVISITGDGFADIIPEAGTIVLSGIRTLPGPGVQIEIDGILDLETLNLNDLYTFSGVEIFDLGDDGSGNGTNSIRVTITPSLRTEYNVAHNTPVTLREKFSQCRISGHDFLDIGTGNFEDTNYPQIYAGGNFFTAAPENEVYESNSGRVFYVSTDQDGNFRTGELFAVQQATGIVTISAQFFDLDGLSELALGGVRLGGSGTVVSEFSTDPTFSADSNNVIPTQRAIASFLSARLSVGGENLEVNALQAGRVFVGGDDTLIDNSLGEPVNIPVDVNILGTYEPFDANGDPYTKQVGIGGTIVGQMLFYKEFDETMQ